MVDAVDPGKQPDDPPIPPTAAGEVEAAGAARLSTAFGPLSTRCARAVCCAGAAAGSATADGLRSASSRPAAAEDAAYPYMAAASCAHISP